MERKNVLKHVFPKKGVKIDCEKSSSPGKIISILKYFLTETNRQNFYKNGFGKKLRRETRFLRSKSMFYVKFFLFAF